MAETRAATAEELQTEFEREYAAFDRLMARLDRERRGLCDRNDALVAEVESLRSEIEELGAELNNHRQFVSWLTDEGTEYGDEWEALLEAGLIVEVKPTDEFIDEWGDDCPMYVLVWKAGEFELLDEVSR
jgi:chromosome segregation ATPase